MLTTILATLVVAAAPAEAQAPPITISLNSGGQYNRGEYAQAQFRAAADGYVLILQTDQNGRIRVLFPLDPGDDNFIRGGKTYKVVGRDNRGSFYLDQAGGSGMVYAAWSKSPFRFTDFVRGDHWDYTMFDQFNAADDPESQLTDFVLNLTNLGFDYAIDRYVVYSLAEYVDGGSATYIGVSGWPWPTYYTGGWSIGIGIGVGCCYDPWYGYGYGWYPAYGWGYPGYGWGYPGYAWGYPGYGWGYPGYGWGYPVGGYYPPRYPGYGYPGYPGYGYPAYPGYRPYTFKPDGTITTPGNPYRPRGDVYATRSSVYQTSYRDRSLTSGAGGLDRGGVDAATINGRAEAGRRPAARPTTTSTPQATQPRTRGTTSDWPTRVGTGAEGRRPSNWPTRVGAGTETSKPSSGGRTGQADAGTRMPTRVGPTSGRSPAPATTANGAPRARGWSADGKQLPTVQGRPSISPSSPRNGGAASGGTGTARRSGGSSLGSQGAGSSQPSARPSQPSSRPSQPSASPQGRSGGSPPAARGGSSGGGRPSGGAAPSSGGGRGGAPSGGGGGRRGR